MGNQSGGEMADAIRMRWMSIGLVLGALIVALDATTAEDMSNLDAPLEAAAARITDLEHIVARYEAIHSDLKQAPPKLKAELAEYFSRTKSCIATTPGAAEQCNEPQIRRLKDRTLGETAQEALSAAKKKEIPPDALAPVLTSPEYLQTLVTTQQKCPDQSLSCPSTQTSLPSAPKLTQGRRPTHGCTELDCAEKGCDLQQYFKGTAPCFGRCTEIFAPDTQWISYGKDQKGQMQKGQDQILADISRRGFDMLAKAQAVGADKQAQAKAAKIWKNKRARWKLDNKWGRFEELLIPCPATLLDTKTHKSFIAPVPNIDPNEAHKRLSQADDLAFSVQKGPELPSDAKRATGWEAWMNTVLAIKALRKTQLTTMTYSATSSVGPFAILLLKAKRLTKMIQPLPDAAVIANMVQPTMTNGSMPKIGANKQESAASKTKRRVSTKNVQSVQKKKRSGQKDRSRKKSARMQQNRRLGESQQNRKTGKKKRATKKTAITKSTRTKKSAAKDEWRSKEETARNKEGAFTNENEGG